MIAKYFRVSCASFSSIVFYLTRFLCAQWSRDALWFVGCFLLSYAPATVLSSVASADMKEENKLEPGTGTQNFAAVPLVLLAVTLIILAEEP